MDMFRLPQHVENELQTFLTLLCPNVILHESYMPKESIKFSNILFKDEKIELFSKVKEEIIELSSKGKEEKSYKVKGKRT
jgi:NCAIR mutase (PurE)-related protein